MGCCYACVKGDQQAVVQWYPAGCTLSLAWTNRSSGFGYHRNKSYSTMAIGPSVKVTDVNRIGNINGEIAGSIVFYKEANKKTNYADLPTNPHFDLADTEKLYAKAFLSSPLNRVPIGENNVTPDLEFRGRGATLLAPLPRAIAIYLTIDGVDRTDEHFCEESYCVVKNEGTEQTSNGTAVAATANNPNDNINGSAKQKTNKLPIKEAIKGSYYTYLISEQQFPFCFIHLPLIGNLTDTNVSTGFYARNFIRCFCHTLSNLKPGVHTVDMRLTYWYDHRTYAFLVLGVGSNTLGRWGKSIDNSRLDTPYDEPDQLACSETVAQGSCTLTVPADYRCSVARILARMDRRPPAEAFTGSDVAKMRKIARTVAAGRFCQLFSLSGLPDWVVLSSGRQRRNFTDVDSGCDYSYSLVEYTALWLNEHDKMRPDAIGYMIDGSMAVGQISHDLHWQDWRWIPRTQGGRILPTRRVPVKNQYINACMKGRRFSMFSSLTPNRLWMLPSPLSPTPLQASLTPSQASLTTATV